MKTKGHLAFLLLLTAPLFGQGGGWSTYGGDAGGSRFSQLKQINKGNVGQLEPAWTFHTHALDKPRIGSSAASFETTPIIFENTLILTDPFDHVFALNPSTGAKVWDFDPRPHLVGDNNLTTSRGVAVFKGDSSGGCSSRVFVGTLDGLLYAIDAQNGKPCLDFGVGGHVDTKVDVGWSENEAYAITSAPVILGNVVVVGSSIPDSQRVQEIRGTIHAYDVHSGKLLWTWDPIASWADKQPNGRRTGAANAWSTMSADPQLGLIYVPTGSASPDHYGGSRVGDDRDANSVVALEASSGRRIWGFQLVHHDLWDYDVATEPLLFDYKGTPALAVAAKPGLVFILDRRTGKPLITVTERPVPQSDVPGEKSSPTQPFSNLPALGSLSLSDPGQAFQGPESRERECAAVFKGKRYEGIYTPPSLRGTLEYPGSIGGVNWGGFAYDPAQQILYANVNNDVYGIELLTRAEYKERFLTATRRVQRLHRLTSLIHRHRAELLLLALAFFTLAILWRRKGTLLSAMSVVAACFTLLTLPLQHFLAMATEKDLLQIPQFGTNASRLDDYSPQLGTPYWMHRKPLSDSQGNPCTKLPWGSLVGLNLLSGAIQFSTVHGPETNGQPTGSFSVSGPIVTAGGLVFSAGTKANALYVYDSTTGQRLRGLDLPGPAQATPMTYEQNGRQYVVIAVGGHGPLEMRQGDSVIAFALR